MRQGISEAVNVAMKDNLDYAFRLLVGDKLRSDVSPNPFYD